MDNNAPMRYATYARYSSDLQRQSSIEDQLRKCHEYGRSQGWIPAKDSAFADEAISGVSTDRPGLQRMLQASTSRGRQFDVILVDDTSRISRNLSDAVQLFERLKFAGVRVIAVGQGIDTHSEQAEVLVTVHGLVDSLYVKELAKKTHRGLEGALLRGLHAGGRCYGYRNVPAEGGGVKLVIEAEEAAVVRRIFNLSADGMSLKSIAAELNRERVPPPRPRTTSTQPSWCPTAIREMLRRELYVGRVIWNRSRFTKVPGTNRRVARPRPRSEWRISDRPELRIINDELWQRVQAKNLRMAKLYGGHHQGLLNRSASSRNLLTGFLKCGLCGGNLVIVTGRQRRHAMYGCPQHFYRSTCSNDLKVRQDSLEKQLLNDLQQALLQPEAIGFALQEFERQLESARASTGQDRERKTGRKKELEEQLQRLTMAVAQSGHSASLLQAIAEREQELAEITESLCQEGANGRSSVEEMRQFAATRLSSLPGLLSSDIARARSELARHIDFMKMTPTEEDGNRRYVCEGDWNLIGSLAATGDVRMVAGGGFEPPTFGL
jgi:site-specific DNA recombinase